MKFLINLIEITVIANVLFKGIRFFVTGKHKKKNSLCRKCTTLISRKMHKRLDEMLEKQKGSANEQQSPKDSKVVYIVREHAK